jgi:hypothetical protein
MATAPEGGDPADTPRVDGGRPALLGARTRCEPLSDADHGSPRLDAASITVARAEPRGSVVE